MDVDGFSHRDLRSERAELLREAILDSLALPNLNNREEQIVDTKGDTFGWIFDSPEHGFKQWLGDERPVFWISGSPGSGKSTLMRLIHENETTTRLVNHSEPHVVAAFFCWESGTILQRSQVGLLRSILQDLLTRHKHLIPETFAPTWARIWKCSTAERIRLLSSWTLEELKDCLLRFMTASNRRRVLLIIDGLDELEGDLAELIQLLRGVEQAGRVKLCLSSRPWEIFREAFHNAPSIQMQDVGKADLLRYIETNLPSEVVATYPGLVEAIAQRSDGVFLWVSLAVQHLTSQPSDIQTHFTKLPKGLDSLYEHLLLSLSPKPIEMAELFALMQSRQEVAAFTRDNDTSIVTLQEYIRSRIDSAVDAIAGVEIKQMDRALMLEKAEAAIDLISTATAKLVMVQSSAEVPLGERSLTFAHRTMKDWLANPIVWSKVDALIPHYSPHIQHVLAMVLTYLQPTQKPSRSRTITSWWSQIILAFTHARFTPRHDQQALYRLLNGLDNVLSRSYLARATNPEIDSWSRTCFGTLEERGDNLFEEPFLGLAVKFGVEDYVTNYFEDYEYVEGKGRSLLFHAIAYLINRKQSVYPLSSPIIVEQLLAAGCRPNSPVITMKNGVPRKGKTPWMAALEEVQQGDRLNWIQAKDIPRWATILRSFIKYEADRSIESIQATAKDTPESLLGLLRRLAEKYGSEELRSLL